MDIHADILIQSIESSNLAHSISLVGDNMPLSYVNQAFLDQTGYTREEVIGHNCRFLQGDGTDPEAINNIRQSIKDCKPIEIEILNYKKDGTPFWNFLKMAPILDSDNKAIAFIGIQSDVTQLREQERSDAERQKLEALGRMSANISHEIKNALQPIKLMAEMLQDWKSLSNEQMSKCLEIISDNISIASSVTRDVLLFSKNTENKIEAISVKKLAEDTERFTKNLLNSRIELTNHVDDVPDTLQVEINQNQFLQVTLNIVNNALHAMNWQGNLQLSVRLKDIDQTSAMQHAIKAGKYICISFQDDGYGIEEKVLQNIFDPFYSNKPVGEGTGLGLSISYKIIKNWGGTITVQSEHNKGSEFTIMIPTL